MTRHVRKVHDVPALGRDPFGWLEAALDVAVRRGADVLLPVQEQVAVMALARDRIEAAGLATAVPGLRRAGPGAGQGVGVPDAGPGRSAAASRLVAATAAEIEAAGARAGRVAAFVKMPIGTASAGVRRAGSPDELRQVAADYERLGALGPDGVLVQAAGGRAAGHGPGAYSPAASSSRSTPASGSARAPRAGPATSSAWTCRRRGSTWPRWARSWTGTARCPRT